MVETPSELACTPFSFWQLLEKLEVGRSPGGFGGVDVAHVKPPFLVVRSLDAHVGPDFGTVVGDLVDHFRVITKGLVCS